MLIDRGMYRLTEGVRWRIAAKVAAGLAAVTSGVTQGIVSAEILTRIFDGRDLASIVPLLGIIGVLIVVQIVLFWYREILAMWIVGGVKLTLRRRLYARLLELGPGYLARTQTGKVQSTVVDGVEALEGYLGFYIPQALIVLIGPGAILIYLFTIDLLVGLVVMLGVLIGAFGAQAFTNLLGEYGERHWNAYREMNVEFLDSMQGLPTLKAFNAGRRQGERLHERAQRLYRTTMAQMSISLLGTGITHVAMAAGTALAVGVGAVQFARGELDATQLFVVLFLSAQCFLPLTEFNMYWHQGFLGLSALSGIIELLDAQPEVRDVTPEQRRPVDMLTPSITFEQVSFGYNQGSRPALRGLSFSAAQGQRVALVGRSGAGKTTVVSLLLRFFDPGAGRILIGGRDLREIPLDELRALMAVVSQDTYLFHGSVADNLRLAKPDADGAALEAAARSANAHEFIMALEHGYDTLIGERGLKLSGGQRQRIAIARALLKDAPILILDEATASVDTRNEALIQGALERLTAARTTLIIAHRLSTIVNADRIIVLEDGQAIETGKHRELLEQRGAYTRLVAAQRG